MMEYDKTREELMMGNSGFFRRPTSSRYCKIPKRYIISIFMGAAMFILQWMAVNFSVFIMHILWKQHYSDIVFPKIKDWSFEDIGIMEASFYWGYAAGQIPGAFLVIFWSSHKCLITSMALSSSIHLLLPMALNHHVIAVIVLNFLQGIAEGPMASACFGMLLHWSPSSERARHLSFVISGSALGLLVGVPLSNSLVESMGEEIGFFSAGFGGLIWCSLWSVYAFGSPSEDPYITQKELSFLEEHTDEETKTPPTFKSIPFKGLLTSFPVIAIVISGACLMINTFIANWSPLFNITNNFNTEGTNSEDFILHLYAPKVVMVLTTLSSGWILDFIVNKSFLSVGTTRKVITCGGFALCGILLIFSSQLRNGIAVAVLQHFSTAFLGLAAVGFAVNCFDISPRCVCLVVGYYSTISSGAGIVFSYVIEKLFTLSIDNHNEWNILLCVVGGSNLVVALVYGIFGSGERQEWDEQMPVLEEVRSGNDARCYPDCSAEEFIQLVEESTLT